MLRKMAAAKFNNSKIKRNHFTLSRKNECRSHFELLLSEKIRLCQGVKRRFVLCIFPSDFETFPSERCKMSLTIERRTKTFARSLFVCFVCLLICMIPTRYDLNRFSFIYDSGIISVWLFPKPRTSCTMVQHEAIGSSQSGLESL